MTAERILVLAPMGRDAQLARDALVAAGLDAAACANVEALCSGLEEGAGAAVLTQEALFPAAAARLSSTLARQPPWSDLPLILFAAENPLGEGANVTLMDRPVRIRTLLSAVHTALRARRRQYQVRDLLAELESSVRERDQFLAMLGHELRNPLAAIVTAAELIDRQAGEQMARERGVIRRQLHHLSRLMNDLLDVSRVTRGKIALRRERVDLRAAIQRAVQDFEVPARAQGLELVARYGPEPPPVEGDLLRIEQIAANLLSNAVKYTNRGGRIEVQVEPSDGQVALRVKDSGMGIAREVLPHIFDLFVQAPGSLDRAPGGMGIGLTLVQRLVELHGGTVTAASDGLGKGSEFVVRLPLLTGPEREAVQQPRESASARERGMLVLLVEDNPDSRDLLQYALEQMGHRVEACGDGLAAIDRALIRHPDAMLVDLGLPGRDGYEVARTVRRELGSGVRLVALTGYGLSGDRDRALAAGFDAFLIKPADLDAVERALRP